MLVNLMQAFNVDTNEGYFLYPHKDPKEMPNMKKSELAHNIMKEVVELVKINNTIHVEYLMFIVCN